MADVFFSDTIDNGMTAGLRANFVSTRRRTARRTCTRAKLNRIPKADLVLFLFVGCASMVLGAAVALVSA